MIKNDDYINYLINKNFYVDVYGCYFLNSGGFEYQHYIHGLNYYSGDNLSYGDYESVYRFVYSVVYDDDDFI